MADVEKKRCSDFKKKDELKEMEAGRTSPTEEKEETLVVNVEDDVDVEKDMDVVIGTPAINSGNLVLDSHVKVVDVMILASIELVAHVVSPLANLWT